MKLDLPKKYNQPENKVSSLKDIWYGKEINLVREKHINAKLNDVEICKQCPFKETYKWKKISQK